MRKAAILSMFGFSIFLILKNYYAQQGHTGLPEPTLLTKPVYAFGVLAFMADLIPGNTVPFLAVATTLGLWYKSQDAATTAAKKPAKKPANKPKVVKKGNTNG
jgi:hypothetical protein